MPDLLTLAPAATRTLPCLATPDAFRAWLATWRPTGIVGYRAEADACPLASFLQAQGYPDPFVDAATIALDMSAEPPLFPTPPWCTAFITRVDGGQTCDDGAVTAQEALGLLDGEEVGPHDD